MEYKILLATYIKILSLAIVCVCVCVFFFFTSLSLSVCPLLVAYAGASRKNTKHNIQYIHIYLSIYNI